MIKVIFLEIVTTNYCILEDSTDPCPGVQDPPRILLMEISTRFFDSLDGGKDVEDVSYGIRSKRGTFFKSGEKKTGIPSLSTGTAFVIRFQFSSSLEKTTSNSEKFPTQQITCNFR